MSTRPHVLVALAVTLAACTSSPLRQIPPAMPEAYESVMSNAANGGRVQSIAVNPTNSNNAVIATQFGGMWHTYNAGKTWFRIFTLPAVYVTDVEYGPDGNTLVATVFRDLKTQNGGGVYVSHTNGDFWSLPATGVAPTNPASPGPTSAYSVSHAPDERGLWYAGTDYGVAISHDDGATWTHVGLYLNPGGSPQGAQSVLAFPGGSVLAMTSSGVFRSDDRGATWRVVITDDFSDFAPANGNVGNSGNKMARPPDKPWAFIFKEFHYTSSDPRKGAGELWFYELDTDTKTLLALPQGRSRGPFVSVSKDFLYGGYRVWVGEGWDGYYVIRGDAAGFRGLLSNATWDDWVSFIAEAGIHADMGDLGLDGGVLPAYVGSDGGIFKPRPQDNWWDIGGSHKWMSAAAPGSSMNSLQISDMGGTNFHMPDGSVQTSLYLTTQDNALYVSPDGGQTWKVGDGGEGFGIEVRHDAAAGAPAQVAYVGVTTAGTAFADTNLANIRPVPNVDENGAALDNMERPFFVSELGNEPSNWVRMRNPAPMPLRQAYYSNNSGANWRRFATINFAATGEMRTVGTVSWLPVFLGGNPNLVGLVPLNTSVPPGVPPPTYDDSDAVRLPNKGSIGTRFTEWDIHAVYAVHPTDWEYLIVPDIVANNMKYTYDGGRTWKTSAGLTAEVLRGGELTMWGGKPDLMEVTEIAFDPYQPGRILVGTRDAGIICTADDGRMWRTIYDSDKIKYITAFHFHPSGSVYISSYGNGLWQMTSAKGCPKSYSFKWDQSPEVNVGVSNAGAIARTGPAPAPRGIALPDNPKLFLTFAQAARGASEEYLTVAGRGFPAGQQIVFRCREIASLSATARVDKAGQFSVRQELPANLPHRVFTIEALLKADQRPLTSAQFSSPYSDEGLLEMKESKNSRTPGPSPKQDKH
jgi:hypothetical protein